MEGCGVGNDACMDAIYSLSPPQRAGDGYDGVRNDTGMDGAK